MFDHVTISVSDRGASERFYDTVLAAIGVSKDASGEVYAEWGDFSLQQAEDRVTRRLHVSFQASSRELVDTFWRAGVDAGYRDSAEAVHHGELRGRSLIDHLWIRVADVAASKQFYETIAPHAGIHLAADMPERARFEGSGSTFSLVDGEPTESVHLAFPAADNATVEAFHRAGIEAGYRDHGGPGERPVYHPGYYGAYLLDPDDNNVEVVNHNRG